MEGENNCSNSLSSNPFAALFPSLQRAFEFRQEQLQQGAFTEGSTAETPITLSLKDRHSPETDVHEAADREHELPQMINDVLQRVFLIAVNAGT